MLGDAALRALGHGRPAEAARLLRGDSSPLATLARLFLLGDVVADDEVEAVLGLDDAGPLLDRAGADLRAAYDVAPHADPSHDWWVVADRTDAGRPRRADHVLGVGGASTTLAQLTVRRPVRRALDIGTGCGVQSVHLSTHATEVTATDVVPRALQLAATTFALSGLDVELRLGDLVEPVAEREFDLVVCNPPFVVGPSTRFAYRDSGEESDGLSRRAVRAAASVLADGGVAQLLVNWLHVDGEDWRDRVAEWVSDAGCDAWLLERDAQEPVDYVATWLADAGEHGDDRLAAEWLQWFADRHVEAVGFGWVMLRRAEGPHRIAVESAPQAVSQPLGEAVAGWLDRVAWLRHRSDDELLRHRFRTAPDVRLDTAARPGPDGWTPVASTLGVDDGFRWRLPCDEPTAALVAGCDGNRPLAAVAAVLALATGADDTALAPAVCATARGLVDRGLLLP